MTTDQRARLASIRRFDQLVAYLRDEMGWPIDSDDFEELTFEYTPEELGIDPKNAAKIQEIKRLRPLVPSQPWGIFFVKFEPRRLPVVALRRILGQVALKKRASANKSERQAWAADDLLFVSNYGDGEERRIAFAHFSKPPDEADLPTLKVLGWDNLDTALHLDAVARELTEHLAWPTDDTDAETWRKQWRAAFVLRHREVVSTSKELSIRLAAFARVIRDRTKTALAIESEKGPLTTLMKAFQTSLVHDLDADGFADMYGQTIAYGLLSARIADPSKKTADDFAAHMRTNPFLRELMETFLRVGGRQGKAGGPGIDFDELGIAEVVELLDDANMEAVVRDFGDKNPQEDPVIHFYELFLKEYDAKKRMQRGVFYTPRPVVFFIVRSVHEMLRTEFDLADGLADITTWGEMVERIDGLEIPQGARSGEAFVQILDPATGTGTFLVEVIDLIHKTMTDKWQGEGHGKKKRKAFWNDYVSENLLPRLHGYELMMAPFAIAHMKIGLKLYETGYCSDKDERARVYLTNALEPAQDFSGTLAFAIPALAHEAEAVNVIKRNQRFTVVIGNPPYSYMSSNLSPSAKAWVEPYRYLLGERIREKGAIVFERAIQDDYVKFIAFAQALVSASNGGLIGLISNASYLDNPNMRGMRSSLMASFSRLRLVHLHGDAKRDPATDENVFDIQTGVAIVLGSHYPTASESSIYLEDLLGARSFKYATLQERGVMEIAGLPIRPAADQFRFVAEGVADDAYMAWPSLTDIFSLTSVAIKTNRDHFVIDFDDQPLRRRIETFIDPTASDGQVCERLNIKANAQWDPSKARDKCRGTYDRSNFMRLQYRPFDKRWIYYHTSVVFNDRPATMRPMLQGDNIALLATRRIRTEQHAHFFVTDTICMAEMLSSADNCNIYPLFVGGEGQALFEKTRCSTIRSPVVEALKKGAGRLSFLDLFHWIYAIVHSPTYRSRYQAQLKADHPRVPLPTASQGFALQVCELGAQLVNLHLERSRTEAHYVTSAVGSGEFQVERVSISDQTVWINKAKTRGFRGVSEEVWNFHIGGYQVCEKWLKDRQAKGGKNSRPGRVLTEKDIDHYQRIVVAISETIRIMAEIDEVIEVHGGWPNAFQTGSELGKDGSTVSKVAESSPRYGGGKVGKKDQT